MNPSGAGKNVGLDALGKSKNWAKTDASAPLPRPVTAICRYTASEHEGFVLPSYLLDLLLSVPFQNLSLLVATSLFLKKGLVFV